MVLSHLLRFSCFTLLWRPHPCACASVCMNYSGGVGVMSFSRFFFFVAPQSIGGGRGLVPAGKLPSNPREPPLNPRAPASRLCVPWKGRRGPHERGRPPPAPPHPSAYPPHLGIPASTPTSGSGAVAVASASLSAAVDASTVDRVWHSPPGADKFGAPVAFHPLRLVGVVADKRDHRVGRLCGGRRRVRRGGRGEVGTGGRVAGSREARRQRPARTRDDSGSVDRRLPKTGGQHTRELAARVVAVAAAVTRAASP